MGTSVMRPGILVALHTSVRGGVQYQRVFLERGEAREKWETTRLVDDPAEHDRAIKARGKIRSLISGVCCQTNFGLLCPESDERTLDSAIDEATRLAGEFNATADSTRVSAYVIKGRIASTDEQAARAISAEIRTLLDDLSSATAALDAEKIRETATRARNVAAILSDDRAKVVSAAIREARLNARAIVRRTSDGAFVAAEVLAEMDTRAAREARFAFLDVAPDAELEGDALPSVDLQRFSSADGF